MSYGFIPDRIARLPKDKRGYPIPWNVLRGVDDTPIFTVNDDRRHYRALGQSLCPICGGKLGKWKWFTGGPRSAFDPNGWYLDLPAHHECATFSLATCPYLAAPQYLKRIDVPDPSKLGDITPVLLDETVMADRPEIFVTVASDWVEINPQGVIHLPYVRGRRPYLGIEYWRHGKQISLEEALPFLRKAFDAEWLEPEVRA